MAIAASSIVSPKRSGSNAGLLLAVAGPIFGIVESGAGPYVVLWNNGQRVEDVVAITLDEITEATVSVQNGFVGRRVKVTLPTGQTNFGIMTCVAAYKRSDVDILLLQADTGAFIEAVPTNCEAVN